MFTPSNLEYTLTVKSGLGFPFQVHCTYITNLVPAAYDWTIIG